MVNPRLLHRQMHGWRLVLTVDRAHPFQTSPAIDRVLSQKVVAPQTPVLRVSLTPWDDSGMTGITDPMKMDVPPRIFAWRSSVLLLFGWMILPDYPSYAGRLHRSLSLQVRLLPAAVLPDGRLDRRGTDASHLQLLHDDLQLLLLLPNILGAFGRDVRGSWPIYY